MKRRRKVGDGIRLPPNPFRPSEPSMIQVVAAAVFILFIGIFLVYQFFPVIKRAEFSLNSPLKGKLALRYFNSRGRAEQIRLLLEDQGIPYEDVRLSKEEWLIAKQNGSFAFGQLPQLESEKDYINIVQSSAIMRFLGRYKNLYGFTALEATKCDMIAAASEDIRNKYGQLVYSEDFEDKRGNFTQLYLPQQFQFLDKLLSHSLPYFVKSEPTFADYMIYDVVDFNSRLDHSLLPRYPNLKKFFDRMTDRPALKSYLQSTRRPIAQNGKIAKWEN